MPTVKKEALEEAVGEALDSFFASSVGSGGDGTAVQPTMSFVPNADGSVTISDPPDRQAAADFCASWDAFETEQQLRMMENEAAACMKTHCYHCGCNPCAMKSEYDTIIKIGDSMQANGASNKAIRFALYRHMSTVFHGHLGAGKREALPAWCIMGDIRDAYPKEEGTEYVGFKSKKTED